MRNDVLVSTMCIQEKEVQGLDKTIKKTFTRSDGPFVRAIDQALASFNVQRQAYYSGTFVGNHVHSCLKVFMLIHKSFLSYMHVYHLILVKEH